MMLCLLQFTCIFIIYGLFVTKNIGFSQRIKEMIANQLQNHKLKHYLLSNRLE